MSRVTIVCALCERPAWLNWCFPVETVRRTHPIACEGLRDLQMVCRECVDALIEQGPERGA